MSGEDLYAVVEHYHRLGIHRAGSPADRATVDWYAAELTRRGLTVAEDPVAFDRYVTDSSLLADDEPIEHLPLFYEWTGHTDTEDVHVVAADAKAGGRDDDLADVLANEHDAVVIATQHPEGSLVAVNRKPHDHRGAPTVLVADRDAGRLAGAGRVRLTMTAQLEPASTTNLIARSAAAPDEPPLLLTTPLTGWFGCAGERGTGVAVLLDLVERFADRPLLVLATGGHELDYLGIRSWVDRTGEQLRGIIHVGASVAVDVPSPTGRELIATRLAMTDLSGGTATRIEAALRPAAFIFRPDTATWLGESEVLCELDVPMLSFTGSGVDFHTPEDTPERATSPAALATVASAIGDAGEALLDATA